MLNRRRFLARSSAAGLRFPGNPDAGRYLAEPYQNDRTLDVDLRAARPSSRSDRSV